MKRKVMVLVISITMLLNLTACTFVSDFLYDLGIRFDPQEVSKEFECFFAEISDDVNNILNGIESFFGETVGSSVSNIVEKIVGLFEYNEISDSFIKSESDGDSYFIEFPLDKVILPASKRTVYLLPLYGFAAIKVYDSKGKNQVSFEEAGVTVNQSYSNGKYSVDEYGTIVGLSSGFSTLSFVGKQQDTQSDNILSVFVAESLFNTENYGKFSDDEKEYISLCLDLSYTLYKVNDPQSLMELNSNMLSPEQILMNINNLSSNLSAFVQNFPGFISGNYNLEKEMLRRNFAEIISDYSRKIDESSYRNDTINSVNDLFDSISLLNSVLRDLPKLPDDILKALKEVDDIMHGINSGVAKIEEIKRLSSLLNRLYSDGMVKDCFKSSAKWLNYAKNTKKTYEDLKESVSSFWKITGYTDPKTGKGIWGLLFDQKQKICSAEIASTLIDVSFITFDTLLYIMYDYETDINVLMLIKEVLLENAEDNSLELEVINDLISEYNSEYISAASKFVGDCFAMAVETLATKNPIMGVSLFCGKIIASTSNVSDKEKVMALSLLASSLYNGFDDIWIMFNEGKFSSDSETLKNRVSLYLNVLLEENKVLLNVASNNKDKQIIRDNIRYIEEDLAIYLYGN